MQSTSSNITDKSSDDSINLGRYRFRDLNLSQDLRVGTFWLRQQKRLRSTRVLRTKRKKTYPKQVEYDKIMKGIVFVMSGFENPRRSRIRDMALSMGAKYQAKWNRFCTHLM